MATWLLCKHSFHIIVFIFYITAMFACLRTKHGRYMSPVARAITYPVLRIMAQKEKGKRKSRVWTQGAVARPRLDACWQQYLGALRNPIIQGMRPNLDATPRPPLRPPVKNKKQKYLPKDPRLPCASEVPSALALRRHLRQNATFLLMMVAGQKKNHAIRHR